MRADAHRNRQKLLAAATRRMADGERRVSLEAVAGDAGVGVGTAYRHFPTREALAEAVYLGEMERLRTVAAEEVAEGPADVALEHWMRAFTQYAAERRGIKEALKATSDEPDFASGRAVLLEGLSAILAAGAADGTLRADLEPLVVLRACGGLWTLAGEPDWRRTTEQLIDVLMAGLRAS